MFDIGWSEMVFVVIIAILVIGPKDLPKTIATIGKYIRKAKGFAREFQTGIDDLAREADLDDLKTTIQGDKFDIKKQIEDAVDPTGDFSTMFDDKPAGSSTDTDMSSENTIGGPAPDVTTTAQSDADTVSNTDTKVPS